MNGKNVLAVRFLALLGGVLLVLVGSLLNSTTLSAQTTGSISGYVYESDGFTPIVGVNICAEIYESWGCRGSGGTTGVDGSYTISDLDPDDYLVNFYGDPNYANEIYQDLTTYGNDWADYTPVVVTAGNDTPNINFMLDPGGTISGTVYDTDGTTPLEFMPVDVGWGAFGACTDASGNYTLSGLPQDTPVTVYVAGGSGNWCEDNNYITQYWDNAPDEGSATTITMTSGTPDVTGIDFTMQLAGSISGTITDGTDPIPTATVCLSDPGNQYRWHTCTGVDVDGTYTIGGLTDGDYIVSANADGYANKFYDDVQYYGNNNPDQVSVTTGFDTPGIDIALDPGGTISGTLYDESMTPLGGVPVDTMPGGFGRCSNPDGTYEITGLPQDTPIKIMVGGSQWGGCDTLGYAQEYWQNTYNQNDADTITLTSGAPNATSIDFTLELGGSVSGNVTDQETGLPIGRVVVNAGFDGYGIGTCTNENGDYTLTGLPTGVSFRVNAGGSFNWCGGPTYYTQEFWDDTTNYNDATVFTLTSGDPNLTGIDFALDRLGTISGVVVNESDDPVRIAVGVRVNGENWYYPYETCSDAVTGEYTLSGLPFDAEIQVRAGDWGSCGTALYVREWWEERELVADADIIVLTTASPDRTGVNFTLIEGGSISGVVTDQDTGLPLLGVWVAVPMPETEQLQDTCTSLVDGTYTLSGLPLDRPIVIMASSDERWCSEGAQGYATEYWEEAATQGAATQITLTAGSKDISGIDFTLKGPGIVAGNITSGPTGLPIANATVNLHTPNWSWSREAVTDANGDYAFDVVTPGDYQLSVTAEAHAWWSWTSWGGSPVNGESFTVVGGGETTTIDLSVPPGGTLSGRVTFSGGEPGIPNVLVNIPWPGSACTDADGYWSIENILVDVELVVTAGGPASATECGGNGTFGMQHYVGPNTTTFFYEEAVPVKVTYGGEVVGNLNFRLFPGGQMSGQITDQDTSMPIVGAEVSIYTDNGVSFDDFTRYTDGTGSYYIEGLSLRDYHVSASASGYPTEWYDGTGGSPGHWDAIPIPTQGPGTLISGIDIALRPSGTITGTITGDVDGLPIQNMFVQTNGYGATCTDASGNYTLDLPRDVELRISAGGSFNPCGGATNYVPEFYDGALFSDTATVIVLTDGTPIVNGIDIAITEAATTLDEYYALVDLYNSTDGDNWENNTGWLQTPNYCSWYGVTCDVVGTVGTAPDGEPIVFAGNRVLVIALSGNRLSGSLSNLSPLASLRSLVLSNNTLTGSLPPPAQIPVTLQTIDLGSNQLEGEIPDLSSHTELEAISLEDNTLTGEIPDLSNAPNLREVDLSDNQLEGSIPDMSGLENLEKVDLGSNTLTGGVPDLSNAPNLRELDLGENQLSGTIPDMTGLDNLEKVDMSDNTLTGEPPDLFEMPALREVNLSDNRLTGLIPALPGTPTLEIIDLSGNTLTGALPDWSSSTGLSHIDFSDNALSGEIPDWSGLTNLEVVNLRDSESTQNEGNQLEGEIPALPDTDTLKEVDLSGNALTGSAPELTNNAYLERLALAENQLNGTLPEIDGMVNLREVDLSGNQITGGMVTVGTLPSLEVLDLGRNQLDGELPDVSDLPSLREVNLEENAFTGTLPDFSGSTNLEKLSVADNEFYGEIPTFSHTTLRELDIASNRFTGTLDNLATVGTLEVLNAHSNALSGEIPPALAALPSLSSIDVRYNMLTSSDPEVETLLNLTNPEWATTQTVTITDPATSNPRLYSVTLSWTPIAYIEDAGYYEIAYANDPGGPWTVHGQTVDKTVWQYVVTDLTPNIPYYFRIQSVTLPHGTQQNTLVSLPDGLAYDVSWAIVSEQALQAQLLQNANDYPDIAYVVVDILPDAIALAVQTVDGTVMNVQVSVNRGDGEEFILFTMDSVTVNGQPAAENAQAIANTQVLPLLIDCFDTIVAQQGGAGQDIETLDILEMLLGIMYK